MGCRLTVKSHSTKFLITPGERLSVGQDVAVFNLIRSPPPPAWAVAKFAAREEYASQKSDSNGDSIVAAAFILAAGIFISTR